MFGIFILYFELMKILNNDILKVYKYIKKNIIKEFIINNFLINLFVFLRNLYNFIFFDMV